MLFLIKLFLIYLWTTWSMNCRAEQLSSNPRHSLYSSIVPRDFHVELKESSVVRNLNPDNFVHKESFKQLSHRDDLQQLHRSEKDQLHTVVIACKQRNLDALKQILFDVSTPSSPQYGQHLTYEEVMKLTANAESANHILKYLQLHEIAVIRHTLNYEYITVEASIGKLERLLKAQFYEFSHVSDPTVRFHRCLDYSLPDVLISHVSHVFNTVQFPAPLRGKKDVRFRSDGAVVEPLVGEVSGKVTPALLKRVYKIDSNDGSHVGSQAIFATIDQTFSPSDLTYFQNYFNLPVEPVAVDIGGHMADNACQQKHGQNCGEANLDVQYMMSTAQHVPTTFYYFEDVNNDFLLSWIMEVSNMAQPPLIFSISYGIDESFLPPSYAEEFDLAAIKLGVQGVTIVASSGDDGAVSPQARQNPLSCGYNPSFPASSPYVTAVGGTMGPEKNNPETACSSLNGGIITSGGGFSTLYDAPSWQESTLAAYFSFIGTNKGGVVPNSGPAKGFNRQGRGFPDLSAVATEYLVAYNAKLGSVSGTSASSPFVAGLFALINSARLKVHKSSLGWINPTLYSLDHSIFNDVTQGNNNCAAGGMVCCAHGFSAVTGWDPVTGLGSPDFGKLRDALVALGELNAPTLSPTIQAGQPTPEPTVSPPIYPTSNPSDSPTIGAGWMFLNEYSDINCEGAIKTAMGVAIGTCFIEYDDQNKPVGSIYYVCDDVQANMLLFSDTACSRDKLIGSEVYGMGCAMRVQDSYYSTDSVYSTSLQCVPQSSDPAQRYIPPSPSTDASYAVQSSFDSLDGCIGPAISEYTLYLENYCFNVESQGYSYKFAFPSVMFYPGLQCPSGKPPQLQALPTTCAAAASGDDYYSGGSYYGDGGSYYGIEGTTAVYNIWSELHGALTPSAGPSVAPYSLSGPQAPPTSRPSSTVPVSKDVVMSIEQLISGIELSTYYKEKKSSDLVLKSAIAKTLSAITTDNVSIGTIKGSPSSSKDKRSLRDDLAAHGLDATSNDQLVLSYTVSFNTVLVGVEDAEEAYNTYLYQMNTALTEGTFDEYLHHYAVLMRVSNLENAHTPKTSNPIVSSRYSSNNSSKSTSPRLSSSALISVIFFSVVVGIILTILIDYWMRKNKYACYTKASNGDYGGINAHDSQHQSEFNDLSSSTKGSALQKRVYTNIFRAGRKLSRKLTRPRGKRGGSKSTSADDLEYSSTLVAGAGMARREDDDLELVEVSFRNEEVQQGEMMINPLNAHRTD